MAWQTKPMLNFAFLKFFFFVVVSHLSDLINSCVAKVSVIDSMGREHNDLLGGGRSHWWTNTVAIFISG